MRDEGKPTDLVQGTLHMLILKTLALEPNHAYGIGTRIGQISKGVFLVNAGSLFPALRRLERDGLIEGDWQVTENNRRAKVYRLTARGRARFKARGARLGGPDRRNFENPEGLTGRVVMTILSRVIGGLAWPVPEEPRRAGTGRRTAGVPGEGHRRETCPAA